LNFVELQKIMDLPSLKFIANDFKKLFNKTTRVGFPNNKYAVLKHDTSFDSTGFLEFILSPEIKTQKAIIIDSDPENKYWCCVCNKHIENEYFEDKNFHETCRNCFEYMRNALIMKKENVTFVFIDKPSLFPHICYIINDKNKIPINIEHIYVTFVNTNPLYKTFVEGKRMCCNYCRRDNYQTKLCHYFEKHNNKDNHITICEQCLKFREYVSFMSNYHFVYINKIFEINNLLPELKNVIAKYMLMIAAY